MVTSISGKVEALFYGGSFKCPIGLGNTYLGLIRNRCAFAMQRYARAVAPICAHVRGNWSAHPRWIYAICVGPIASIRFESRRPGAMRLHDCVEMPDQCPPVEWLAQEADRSGIQCLRPCALLGKGGNEDDRQATALRQQVTLQLDSAHPGHLHIRDHAERVIHLGRGEELLRRRKCVSDISERAHKPVRRDADRRIIIMIEITGTWGNARYPLCSVIRTRPRRVTATWWSEPRKKIILRFVR
jgi:hypothetical protein